MCLGFLAWFGFFLPSHSSRAVINMVNSYVVSNPRVKKSLAQSQLTDNLLTASERGRQPFWPETMALTERSLEQRTDSTRLVCPRSLHAWPRKQREGAAATIAKQLLLQMCQTAGHSPHGYFELLSAVQRTRKRQAECCQQGKWGRQKAM